MPQRKNLFSKDTRTPHADFILGLVNTVIGLSNLKKVPSDPCQAASNFDC